jgi:hypothetical protein
VRGELPALELMLGRGERDFHSELTEPTRLALADALDLGRMQQIDFPAALMLALIAHPVTGEGPRA